MNLLEDLVDVGRVGLLASTLLLLLVTFSSGCLLDGFLSRSFSSGSLGSRGLASSRSGFLLFEIEGEGVNCFGLRVADERKREKTNLGGGGFGSHSD